MGWDSELVRGGGGIFDVWVDGDRVYCKHDSGDFPDEDALVASLESG